MSFWFWVLGLLAILAAGWIIVQLARSKPFVRGRLTVVGLDDSVTIYRDSRGIAHIEAKTEPDLYFGQGFAVAQDRLWQMDLMRRLARGQLSEVLGSATLESDRCFRTLGLDAAASLSLAASSARARANLDAYSRGVNALIDHCQAHGKLPLEFRLLRYRPRPWTAEDSLTVGKLLAFTLSMNLRHEMFRLELLRTKGWQWLAELLPKIPDQMPLTIDQEDSTGHGSGDNGSRGSPSPWSWAIESVEAELRQILHVVGTTSAPGSNAWVLSGRRTASGKPILANDPHVEMRSPAYWHQIRLHRLTAPEQDTYTMVGVSIPGLPGLLAGHNPDLAWGITNSEADTQDLLIESVPAAWTPADAGLNPAWTITEAMISVRGADPVRHWVVTTPNGPVISDLFEKGIVEPEKNRHLVVLKWVGFSASRELDAIFDMNVARSWDEFREALKAFGSPSLNFIVAAAAGTIAFKTAGTIPLRRRPGGWFPTLSPPDSEPQAFIPFDQLPESVNPESGIIFNSNNKIIGDTYPYFLTADWVTPYRAQRIRDVLSCQTQVTATEMIRLQGDCFNLQAHTLLPYLVNVLQQEPLTPVERRALKCLEKWDFFDHATASAPLIFQFLIKEIEQQVFQDGLGETLFAAMPDLDLQLDDCLRRAAAGETVALFAAHGGSAAVIARAFRQTVVRAAQLQGPHPERWSWGRFHRLRFRHPLATASRLVALMFHRRSRAMGGSGLTVCLMNYDRATGTITEGAPWRQVVEFTETGPQSFDVLRHGSSAYPFTASYDAQSNHHANLDMYLTQISDRSYRSGPKLSLIPSGEGSPHFP